MTELIDPNCTLRCKQEMKTEERKEQNLDPNSDHKSMRIQNQRREEQKSDYSNNSLVWRTPFLQNIVRRYEHGSPHNLDILTALSQTCVSKSASAIFSKNASNQVLHIISMSATYFQINFLIVNLWHKRKVLWGNCQNRSSSFHRIVKNSLKIV